MQTPIFQTPIFQKPIAGILTLGLAAALLTPTLITPTFAQFAPRAGAGRAHMGGGLKKMANALNLTDTQKAQLKPILQNQRQQAKAIKEDTSLTPDARKAKLRELNQSTRSQMQTILTPEQREKLKAMRQERREAKGNNG